MLVFIETTINIIFENQYLFNNFKNKHIIINTYIYIDVPRY